jgi:uncharacterized protein (TIGR03437 family)
MAWGDDACNPQAPCFSAASVVNAASYVTGALAPNTLASIFGSGFLSAYGTALQVLVGGISVPVSYSSSQQVNFLVSCLLIPGTYSVVLIRDGVASSNVEITLASVAPAFFQLDASDIVAARPDWSLITSSNPAKPGDIVTLYATGLGRTNLTSTCVSDDPPTAADSIPLSTFEILLDGVAVPQSQILYAGVAPGFSGLYQVNLQLPAQVGANPEVRMSVGGVMSPPNVHLYVQPQ